MDERDCCKRTAQAVREECENDRALAALREVFPARPVQPAPVSEEECEDCSALGCGPHSAEEMRAADALRKPAQEQPARDKLAKLREALDDVSIDEDLAKDIVAELDVDVPVLAARVRESIAKSAPPAAPEPGWQYASPADALRPNDRHGMVEAEQSEWWTRHSCDLAGVPCEAADGQCVGKAPERPAETLEAIVEDVVDELRDEAFSLSSCGSTAQRLARLANTLESALLRGGK